MATTAPPPPLPTGPAPVGSGFSNSYQSGAARGALAVTIACRDGSVEIRVQDDGPGLPEDFDPENPGGFGTTMVQAMVSQLEGTIRFESSHSPESHGTLVVLVFPQEMRG